MKAPFYASLADGPDDGFAEWATASDGRRIRVAAFGLTGVKGTVFLFPGRSEYIEKYGRTASDLLARGYCMACIDWRGQGLAARDMADPLPGHVGAFLEYQQDIAALFAFARASGLPEPFFLLAHSMGGCIGLRSLMSAHPFRAVAFSSPMWGILMQPWQRVAASVVPWLACRLGFGHAYAPGTGPAAYVTTEPFADNTLTTDPEMWAYMGNHLRAEPKLALGGPTMAWLHAALVEGAALARMPSPDLSCYTGLGSHERIVDPAPIRARMARWPKGRLELFEGAEHELLMERRRVDFLDRVTALFDASGGEPG